jgi:hypothetical protein
LSAGLVGCGGTALPEAPVDAEDGPVLAEREDAVRAAACGVPALKRAREVSSAEGDVCTGAVGDDEGYLALGTFNPGSRMTGWRMVSPEGTPLGGLGSTLQTSLLPQPRGFHAITWDGLREAELSVYSRGAELLLETTVLDPEDSPGRAAAAADPAGGTLVVTSESVDEDHWRVMARRYDAAGKLISGPRRVAKGQGPDAPFVYAAVDLKGRSLVLWDTSVAGQEPHVLQARWLNRDGTAVTPEFVASVETRPAGPPRISPLIGGGVALGRGNAWLALLPNRASAPAPVPAWLAAYPAGRLHVLRNGRGYAVLPPRSYAPVCEQTVTLLGPDGSTCGALRVPISPCQPAHLELGRDGTLLQTLGGDRCTLRWWPRQLR